MTTRKLCSMLFEEQTRLKSLKLGFGMDANFQHLQPMRCGRFQVTCMS